MTSIDAVQPDSKRQEFQVHACGNLYRDVEHFIGKFTSSIDVFQQKKSGWKARRKQEDASSAKRRRTDHSQTDVTPWELLDSAGQVKHTGQPEMGTAGAGGQMSYFVLVKEGQNFTALPVKGWYSFRPNFRTQKVMSLEEAEEKMKVAGNSVQLNTDSRLGALAAKADTEQEEAEEGNEDGDQPDSDEERETIRAARMKAAQTEAEKGGTSKVHTTPGSAVQEDVQEKGEDWEHEEERADDDLEQGEEEGSDVENAAGNAKRSQVPEPDSDGDDQTLTGEGQEINRILRQTHLSSPSASDGDVAESDGSDDDLDLDAMASKLMPNEVRVKERSPSVPQSSDSGTKRGKNTGESSQREISQPSLLGPNANKRKAATPPVRVELKKPRPEVKAEARRDAKESSTQSEATSGPPSVQEIAACLKAWGPVTAAELSSRFKKRLPSKDDKKNFTANVKKVSKLEERPPGSGRKFVVLK